MGYLQILKKEKNDKNNHYSFTNTKKNYYPISFLREMKFFFDINYDEVSQVLVAVEKIKELKKIRTINLEKLESLTNKEREVFNLVVKGLSTKKIAKKLFVQTLTISTHRKRIKEKLDFDSLYDWFLLAKSIQ